ncbi:MAG: tetratricopeptide repeat protein [Planctomycetota bacterium]
MLRQKWGSFGQRLFPGLIVAAGIAVYLNSFSGVFVLDDARNIAENARIRHLWPPWEIPAGAARPVVELSFAINYALGRLEVFGYHLVNLAVHLLAALTLYGVVRRTLLLNEELGRVGHVAPGLALSVALLWVVHPLLTQSVTYIVQRAEALMGFFYLLTLYCVIRGAGSSRAWAWYGPAIIACALGMGSKEVMVTAPFMVLLYDRTFLARSLGLAFRRRGGLYLGLAATWGVLFACGYVQAVLTPRPTPGATVGFAFTGITPVEYLLTQPGVILHYLRLSLWPAGLCLDYGWPVARTLEAIVPPALLVGALFAGTLWALWRKPWVGLVGAWFFLILAPTSSFIPIRDPLFEHRMYLSLAAVVVLVVFGGHALLARICDRRGWRAPVRQGVAIGLVVAAAVTLGLTTVHRNRAYHSVPAMWSDVVAKRPGNPRGHGNLATACDETGRLEDAVTHYREELRLMPASHLAHYQLGNVLYKLGRYDEAVEHLAEGVRYDPLSAEKHFNLGNALVLQGKLDAGCVHLREAVRLRPSWAEAHASLADALIRTGNAAEGVEQYGAALRINPANYMWHNRLGVALERSGQNAEATIQYREALRVEPDGPEALYNLGTILSRQGEFDEAIAYLGRAVQRRPDSAETHTNLGLALLRSGRTTEAFGHLTEAARLKPDLANARYHLGELLAAQGRIEPAIEEYRAVLRLRPDHAQTHFKLGELLERLDRREEAMAEYREALRTDPDHQPARQALARMTPTTEGAEHPEEH